MTVTSERKAEEGLCIRSGGTNVCILDFAKVPRCRALGMIKRARKENHGISEDPRYWVDMVAISGRVKFVLLCLQNAFLRVNMKPATASGIIIVGRKNHPDFLLPSRQALNRVV